MMYFLFFLSLSLSLPLFLSLPSSLPPSLPELGYHEDLQTRTSFIEVLTSILKQGAEFNSLADTALADRFNRMLELVTMQTDEGDFPILMALINAVAPENVVCVCVCVCVSVSVSVCE